MKKIVLLAVISVTLGLGTFAYATLIDLGNGVTQDDRGTTTQGDDQYWVQDLNVFSDMTYDQQIIAISNLNYSGLTNVTWRMARYSDLLGLEELYPMWTTISEIADTFVPTGTSGGYPHWSGRYDRVFYSSNPLDPNAPYHYEANIWMTESIDLIYGWGLNIGTSDSIAAPQLGAFVVGSVQQPAPVPEPSTMLLLGAGLVGFIGFRRFRK